MINMQDMNLKNKTVILRCDYNVPIEDGLITDDTKIKASFETINYLIENNCKIIILSHLGRVKTVEDKSKNSLKIVYNYLKDNLNVNTYFVEDNTNPLLKEYIDKLANPSIVLLENTRYTDIPDKKESICDEELSKFWSSLGDVFVLDAFASAHRKHSSTYGISNYIPSCVGFLVQKEVRMLNNIVNNERHPFTIIMGGAKVDDKLILLRSLLKKCDYILIGGGMANSFLKAQGHEIGKSLVTDNEDILNELREYLDIYKEKINLPTDFICIDVNGKIVQKNLSELTSDDTIYDVAKDSIDKYEGIINNSELIFMNGTMGLYQDERFQAGTVELLKKLISKKNITYVGGGDGVASIKQLGFGDYFLNLSTGGGATLDYIANGNLIALENIGAKNE
ncbi:MAG: phosphoglycerate kinase [Bacilli bacterium]|nr:phosphoglycerate kinase [Bacilli bacterium]